MSYHKPRRTSAAAEVIVAILATITLFTVGVAFGVVLPAAIIGAAIYYAALAVGLKDTYVGACAIGVLLCVVVNLFRFSEK